MLGGGSITRHHPTYHPVATQPLPRYFSLYVFLRRNAEGWCKTRPVHDELERL
jgi:hypothetical protein